MWVAWRLKLKLWFFFKGRCPKTKTLDFFYESEEAVFICNGILHKTASTGFGGSKSVFKVEMCVKK